MVDRRQKDCVKGIYHRAGGKPPPPSSLTAGRTVPYPAFHDVLGYDAVGHSVTRVQALQYI